MSAPKPTDAAMKAAKAINHEMGGAKASERYVLIIAQLIDRHADLPKLTVIALAAQGVVDAGTAHGGMCECELCEAWQTLKNALDALSNTP